MENRLKELRKKADLKQEEVAEKIGFSTYQYARLERGEVDGAIPMLLELSKLYRVTIDYILNNETIAEVEFAQIYKKFDKKQREDLLRILEDISHLLEK